MFKIFGRREKYDIPFVPSSDDRLETMIKLADIRPSQFAADLGAGDGRVLIALARAGAYAYGFEIDPGRYELAKRNVTKAGFQNRVFVYNLDFWKVDFKPFEIVTIYGTSYIMDRLEKKLWGDLKPGAKVISNLFEFPRWKANKSVDDVHLYKR